MIPKQLEEASDGQLEAVLALRTGRRKRNTSRMRWVVLGLFAAVVGGAILSPLPETVQAAGLGVLGVGAAIALAGAFVMIGNQRVLDAAVSELRTRGTLGDLSGFTLEPLDGSGLLPKMLATSSVSIALLLAMIGWVARLMSMSDAPAEAFWQLGVAIIVALFMSVLWMFVLLVWAARLRV